MSSLFSTYNKWEVEVAKGQGSYLIDTEGKEYLDFVQGIAVNNFGHCHPTITKAVKDQLDLLWHSSNLFQIKQQEEVAKILTEHSVCDHVFFCNSGAEANEAAIKLARKATGKHKIISMKDSFHGRTFATMSATGQEKIHGGFGPLLSSFDYSPFNDTETLLKKVNDDVAAIMIEVVQGEGGVRVLEPSFAKALIELTKEKEILLIIDEVQTGIGRTGSFFAYEQFGLSPDIVTLAKGLGNGFPVGAMLGKAHLNDAFQAGSHGSTFGGNPLAMTAAKAVLEELLAQDFQEIKEKATKWKHVLREELMDHSFVNEVRGLGFLIGIACSGPVNEVITKIRRHGLLVLPAGLNVIRLLPPINVSEQDLNKAVQIIKQSMNESKKEISVS
ncbi:acetylornithine transaminase [Alkalihalobacillus pseudalcaliphilus]|uniref:acetylornithine transaminase n=1 Tax=Alkalihalobacillus pseudalcaliphilus TaxID=79884 RepID=UPI00064DECAD|nr:acetylornithine transaminase [Alkalihalobacillus pseudalcaliphilus]KMK74767.1 acetylornithine aminotransferase [Alkalihalobacillus pseudalcaliphilus]